MSVHGCECVQVWMESSPSTSMSVCLWEEDTQGPNHPQCLLPSVTHVPPAKKITFLKRGDARFAGVRLAVHQRSFKTFSALMDELSQRVPLSFGVRSVTTPRGLHGLSALEQLQDGGCYLCSESPPRPPVGRDLDGGREVPGASSSWKGPRAPRRITLVKNRDPRFQETVVLSHRSTRSLVAFLSKASDLLRFPVRQIYTTSGKKVDSLQALLRGPSTLVCAGNEAFRPPALESAQKNKTETLSGMTSRNKHSEFALGSNLICTAWWAGRAGQLPPGTWGKVPPGLGSCVFVLLLIANLNRAEHFMGMGEGGMRYLKEQELGNLELEVSRV
uniref:Retinitis pigmentosa 1-like 1 protein n=1 Tax=Marmota marmota marmota TaxID=9994 RepID=A0A8C6ET45_MARMA